MKNKFFENPIIFFPIKETLLHNNKMIIHLDSSFRNMTEYPFNTEYTIDFNTSPPDRLQTDDPRCLYTTYNEILFSFRWIGNGKNPFFSQIARDSLIVDFVPIGPSKCLLPSFNRNYSVDNDYFVGLLFVDKKTRQATTIVQFESFRQIVYLEDPIFQNDYISSYSVQHDTAVNTRVGWITNPTYWYNKNLIILGSTNLIASSKKQFVLAKGLNTDLYVENVTQNWISKIQSFGGMFRSVLLESFPSYQSNDFWLVWRTPYRVRHDTDTPLLIQAIRTWVILESSPGLITGDIVSSGNVVFRVLDHTKIFLQSPGSGYSVGDTVRLVCERDNTLSVLIRVQIVGIALKYTDVIMESSFYLIAFLNQRDNTVLYFSVLWIAQNIIYLDISQADAVLLNETIFIQQGIFITYWISYQSYLPNIIAPIVPHQNPVCYSVQILSISLPNQPVCGVNTLLSDFPFVFVTLQNQNQACGESIGTLISNQPAATTASFLCPIANIKNPDTVKFVVVKSFQDVIFRFTPQSSLLIRITLPDGQLLRYKTTDNSIINFDSSLCNTASNLNTSVYPNGKIVYAYDIEDLVSITFQFTEIQSIIKTS